MSPPEHREEELGEAMEKVDEAWKNRDLRDVVGQLRDLGRELVICMREWKRETSRLQDRVVRQRDEQDRERGRLEDRLAALERTAKGAPPEKGGAPEKTGIISLAFADIRWLLIGAILVGVLFGKAGIDPLQWLMK